MSGASEKQIEFVKQKLKLLAEEKGQIQSKLDGYINKITSEAQDWISKQGRTHQNFYDICSKIDRATCFVVGNLEGVIASEERDQSPQNFAGESTTSYDVLQDRVAALEQSLDKINQLLIDNNREKGLSILDDKLSILEANVNQLSGDLVSQTKLLQNEIREVTKNQAILSGQNTTNQKVLAALQTNQASTNSALKQLTTRVDHLSTDIYNQVLDIHSKNTQLEVDLKNYADKLNRFENTLCKETKKIASLEKLSEKSSLDIQNKHDEEKYKYEFLCLLIAQRLVPLEKLQTVLNRRIKDGVSYSKREVNLQLLLLGKQGQWKSRIGNFLLGSDVLVTSSSGSSVTACVQRGTVTTGDVILTVVDTPGIGDSDTELQRFLEHLGTATTMVPHGFHAFVYVVKYETASRNEDFKVLDTLKKIFGKCFLKNYGLLLVIYKQNCQTILSRASIEKETENQDGNANNVLALIKEFENRAIFLDNWSVSTEVREKCLSDLLEMVRSQPFYSRPFIREDFVRAKAAYDRETLEEKDSTFKNEILQEIIAINTDLRVAYSAEPNSRLNVLKSLITRAENVSAKLCSKNSNHRGLVPCIQMAEALKINLANDLAICERGVEEFKQLGQGQAAGPVGFFMGGPCEDPFRGHHRHHGGPHGGHGHHGRHGKWHH